jgi:hypothetical protein
MSYGMPGGGWGPPPQPGGGYGYGHGAPSQPPMQGNPFTPRLADTPRPLRVSETFGFFPASLATAALLAIFGTFVMAITEGGFDNLDQMKFCAGAAAVAAACIVWEIYRRTHPTTLVVAGDRIGLYRKGMLEGVVGFGQITWFRLNIVNSIREYMLFGIFGFGGIFGVLGSLSVASAPGVLWSAAAMLGGVGGLASSIWSRGMCMHYYVPKGGGTETVVLRKSELARVGWPAQRWG